MMHDVADIPPVMKLQYLKATLSGEAGQLLRNIPISTASYDGAWSLLRKRYDNKRILLDTHLNRLLSCQTASKESAAYLKRLIDTTEESLRALRSLGRPVAQWDDWIVHLLSQKLDASSRHDWETSLAADTVFPTYEELSTFIETRIRVLESTRAGSRTEKTTPSSATTPAPRPRVSSSSLAVSTERTRKFPPKRTTTCPLCSGEHFVGYCPKFVESSVQQRAELAKQSQLCSNCLRSGHRHSDCSIVTWVIRCHRSHRSSLGVGHAICHTMPLPDPTTNPGNFGWSSMRPNRRQGNLSMKFYFQVPNCRPSYGWCSRVGGQFATHLSPTS